MIDITALYTELINDMDPLWEFHKQPEELTEEEITQHIEEIRRLYNERILKNKVF